MPLFPIYYDTETTGLLPEKDRIIEIAAYDPLHERSFSELINPKIPIPREPFLIHQISDEMVRDAPSFSEVGNRFIEFCGKDCVLIAHNNDAFDRPFLEAEFARVKIEMPKWHFLDSLKWARKYRKDLPRHPLQYLREIYEIPPNQAHRALNDVIILHQVFSRMIDDLPLEQVLKLLEKPTKMPLTMPFGKYQGKALKDIPKNYVEWLEKSGSLNKKENKALRESFSQLGML